MIEGVQLQTAATAATATEINNKSTAAGASFGEILNAALEAEASANSNNPKTRQSASDYLPISSIPISSVDRVDPALVEEKRRLAEAAKAVVEIEEQMRLAEETAPAVHDSAQEPAEKTEQSGSGNALLGLFGEGASMSEAILMLFMMMSGGMSGGGDGLGNGMTLMVSSLASALAKKTADEREAARYDVPANVYNEDAAKENASDTLVSGA
ncbi:MAG: hypothetical protein LBS18_01650 [Clostridiales bacterium]|jgi:hypothetical protein|nr:hypothetical protein [Clostridiales bacterium]